VRASSRSGRQRSGGTEVLAKFPPTLLVTGTRGMELSSALCTHNQLLKARVDAQIAGLGNRSLRNTSRVALSSRDSRM